MISLRFKPEDIPYTSPLDYATENFGNSHKSKVYWNSIQHAWEQDDYRRGAYMFLHKTGEARIDDTPKHDNPIRTYADSKPRGVLAPTSVG